MTDKKLQYSITSKKMKSENGEEFVTHGLEAYIDLNRETRLKVFEFEDFSVRLDECEAFVDKLIKNAVSLFQLQIEVLKQLGSV